MNENWLIETIQDDQDLPVEAYRLRYELYARWIARLILKDGVIEDDREAI